LLTEGWLRGWYSNGFDNGRSIGPTIRGCENVVYSLAAKLVRQ